MGFERATDSIRVYESLIIPGLLQVEHYAYLITRSIFPTLNHETIKRHVELRLARQALLASDDAPTLSVVLDEAAIQRLVGMPHVIRDQLRHLTGAAHMPNVTFQILPFAAGAHGGMIGPFMILGFPHSADPDVIHLEFPTGDLYLDSADQVLRYTELFDRLQNAALSSDESAAFLAELARNL